MVTNEKMNRAIGGIKDGDIKQLFTKGYGIALCPEFVRSRKSEFKKLFPSCYDEMLSKLDDVIREGYLGWDAGWFLETFLCLELGILCSDKPESVVDAKKAGIHLGEKNGRLMSDFYKKSLNGGKFTVNSLLKFINSRPEYLYYFMPFLASADQSELWEALVGCVENAKLEDSVRIMALYAMLSTENASALIYFTERIEEKNYYRLKAMGEAITLLGNYAFILPAKEVVSVLKDAASGAAQKYLQGDFLHTYYLLKALARTDRKSYDAFLNDLLEKGSVLSKQAAYYTMSAVSVSKTYAERIFSSEYELSFCDIAFLMDKINVGLLDVNAKKLVFEKFLNVLKNMDRVNYHFKTSEEVPLALDLPKRHLVKVLAEIAVNSSAQRVNELDSIYFDLNEESQAQYLSIAGGSTKLDKRACAVRFLKTDNYSARDYYDKSKIVLTFNEAVEVSDFLKTKKEPIKEKIIKEFLASKSARKIAEYLLECGEEYKKNAGAEMMKSFGKIENSKLKTTQREYFWTKQSVFKTEYPKSDIDGVLKQTFKYDKSVKPLKYATLKALIGKISNLLRQNKDFEYDAAYSAGRVTLGSYFYRTAESVSENLFESYPKGEEFKKLFLELSEKELTAFSVLMFCESEDFKNSYLSLYSNIFGVSFEAERTYGLLSKMCSSRNDSVVYSVLSCLRKPVYFELLSSKAKRTVALIVSKVIAKKTFCHAGTYIEPLSESGDAEDNRVAAYALCLALSKNVCPCVNGNAFSNLVERGFLTESAVEYMILKWEMNIDSLFRGKNSVLPNDYPNVKFKNFVLGFAEKCIETELNRGSLATPCSRFLVMHSEIFLGAENYLRAIAALRKLTWARSPSYLTEKNVVLSRIVKYSRKSESDTYESFCETVRELKITREELLRATLFNPEYVNYTEKYLEFPHLKLAVYYFYAHLNEFLYGEEKERREEKIKEFSEIDYKDFKDGAFDCNWYHEIVSKISEKDFQSIYDNAKYVTVGGLHKRAQRFFDAMNGRLSEKECVEKILSSRNKDYCLAYSLVPVADKNDLRKRYLFFREFLRESAKFGSQRQMSERRLVDIALENLARNAGYYDTNVFIFEMEAEDSESVFETKVVDGVEFTPVLDDKKFSASLQVVKEGKVLSAVPSKYRKNETVLKLRETVKELNKKIKRVKSSLERAMCEGAVFSAEQLQTIGRDKVLALIMSKLVFLSNGKLALFDSGKVSDFAGCACSEVKVAHPVDLKKCGLLEQAVDYVVQNNVKQPFKQILREIYTKSPQECEETEVLRFKGFNVDLKKCVAALKGKGWGVSDDVGLRKVYYSSNVIAAIFREFDDFYILDYSDVNRELHGILFYDRKTGETLPIKDVDDVTFSEALRDVDLMITISSQTVYDFELAKSTVEVRREILRSIISVLKLDNVGFLKDNISVKGYYGEYLINIRTGLVFKEGVGNLLLDTVYSANKALLLDFIDEDPMTADIISKAVVLSADKKIRDPSVLREITG